MLDYGDFCSCFNPRICKRCDVFLVLRLVVLFGFNPRICKRCDREIGNWAVQSKCFNPRICKRCDSRSPRLGSRRHCFNPRICKRCDINRLIGRTVTAVSIHASVKDATTDDGHDAGFRDVSIHASVKDATQR